MYLSLKSAVDVSASFRRSSSALYSAGSIGLAVSDDDDDDSASDAAGVDSRRVEEAAGDHRVDKRRCLDILLQSICESGLDN